MSEPLPDVTSRRVPLLVPITGVADWDWRESYVILLAFVVPGALLVRVPILFPVVAVALVVLGVGRRVHRISGWWRLLRSGQVVAVDSVGATSTKSGNIRLSHATGWRVHRGWYTGEIVDSALTYIVSGEQRTLEIRGLPYTSGIVLAHPTRPEARCVSAFPFDIRLRDDDRWSVTVPRQFWAGAAATTVLYGALVAWVWWW